MNRYPLWKYITVLVALVLGLLYTLPNFFGESPAVQVSSAKVTLKIEPAMLDQVAAILKQANIEFTASNFETNGPVGTIRFRFKTTDQQIIARDVIEKALNPIPILGPGLAVFLSVTGLTLDDEVALLLRE
jgi:preprotein translocase subunit SecD